MLLSLEKKILYAPQLNESCLICGKTLHYEVNTKTKLKNICLNKECKKGI